MSKQEALVAQNSAEGLASGAGFAGDRWPESRMAGQGRFLTFLENGLPIRLRFGSTTFGGDAPRLECGGLAADSVDLQGGCPRRLSQRQAEQAGHRSTNRL